LIVAANESQLVRGTQLVRLLDDKRNQGSGVDVLSDAKQTKLISPDKLEIRSAKGGNGDTFLIGLTEAVKRFTGPRSRIGCGFTPNVLDSGTYEIWFSQALSKASLQTDEIVGQSADGKDGRILKTRRL
jgi:hypothetical protein